MASGDRDTKKGPSAKTLAEMARGREVGARYQRYVDKVCHDDDVKITKYLFSKAFNPAHKPTSMPARHVPVLDSPPEEDDSE